MRRPLLEVVDAFLFRRLALGRAARFALVEPLLHLGLDRQLLGLGLVRRVFLISLHESRAASGVPVIPA